MPVIEPLVDVEIGPAVAALPKADIHLHSEAGPRLEQVIAQRCGGRVTDWRAHARELMRSLPPGMPRLETWDPDLPLPRATVDERDRHPDNFKARVSRILVEAALDGAVLVEVLFGGSTILREDFLDLFAEALAEARSPVSAPAGGASGRRQDDRRVGRNPAAALHRGRRARSGGAEHPAGAVRSAGGLVRGAWLGGACARCRTGHHRPCRGVRHAAPGRGAGSPRPDADRACDRRCLRRRLLDRIAERGVTIECPLSSNVVIGAVESYESHPIRRFVERGIPVTICTDDPVKAGTTIGREYAIASELGFSIAELLACTQAAVAASFCDDEGAGPAPASLVGLRYDGSVMDVQEAKQLFRGPMVSVATPFTPRFDLDLDALRDNIEFMLDRGMATGKGVLLVAAAGGEFPMLTMEERKEVIRASVEAAAGRIPVAASVQFDGTREIIELAHYAHRVGASLGQLSAPSYYPPPVQDICELFEAVSEETELPIMIYNNWWTTPNMNVDTVDRLARLPGVVALKWSSSSMSEYTAGLHRFADRLAIIDNLGMAVWAHLLGAVGFITHQSNFWPEYPLSVWELLERKDYDAVVAQLAGFSWPWDEWTHQVGQETEGEGPFIKAAMEEVGLAAGPPRPPARPVSARLRQELRSLFADSGVPRADVTSRPRRPGEQSEGRG